MSVAAATSAGPIVGASNSAAGTGHGRRFPGHEHSSFPADRVVRGVGGGRSRRRRRGGHARRRGVGRLHRVADVALVPRHVRRLDVEHGGDGHQWERHHADPELRRRRPKRPEQLRWVAELRRRRARPGRDAVNSPTRSSRRHPATTARRPPSASTATTSRSRCPATAVFPFTVAPTDVAFPDTAVGDTSSVPVVITNISSTSLTPNYAGGAPNDPTNFGGSQNCAGVALAGGQSCQFTYTFTPTAPGPWTSSTTIDIDSESFAISLHGTGTDSSNTDHDHRQHDHVDHLTDDGDDDRDVRVVVELEHAGRIVGIDAGDHRRRHRRWRTGRTWPRRGDRPGRGDVPRRRVRVGCRTPRRRRAAVRVHWLATDVPRGRRTGRRAGAGHRRAARGARHRRGHVRTGRFHGERRRVHRRRHVVG